jgi:ADP-ribose pyrophosphatase YjhB (NUDIX family)
MNKNKDRPYIGVDAIIQNNDGNILLIKRSETSKTYPGMWSLVSGMIEWKETVIDALRREVKEEIGQEIYDIEFTGRYYDTIGRHPTKTVICLPHQCKLRDYDFMLEPREVSALDWFLPSEIENMDLAFDHKQMLIDEKLI